MHTTHLKARSPRRDQATKLAVTFTTRDQLQHWAIRGHRRIFVLVSMLRLKRSRASPFAVRRHRLVDSVLIAGPSERLAERGQVEIDKSRAQAKGNSSRLPSIHEASAQELTQELHTTVVF